MTEEQVVASLNISLRFTRVGGFLINPRGDVVDDGLEGVLDGARQALKLVPTGEGHHGDRVHRFDNRPIGLFVDNHIAGEQQADVLVKIERLVRPFGVADSEDLIAGKGNPQLLLK